MDFGIASVAGITAICYLVGFGLKASPVDNKWIPLCAGICGGILGVVGFVTKMPDFPATDLITSVAVGIVSGLSATGVDQINKQICGK